MVGLFFLVNKIFFGDFKTKELLEFYFHVFKSNKLHLIMILVKTVSKV